MEMEFVPWQAISRALLFNSHALTEINRNFVGVGVLELWVNSGNKQGEKTRKPASENTLPPPAHSEIAPSKSFPSAPLNLDSSKVRPKIST